MTHCVRVRPLWPLLVIAAMLVSACGGGDTPLATTSDITATGNRQGVTPFIHFIELRGSSLAKVIAMQFSIDPKVGTVSKAVSVNYSIDMLKRRGYAVPGSGSLTLPVFGMYAGYLNRVSLKVTFQDASTQIIVQDIASAAYVDPNGIYDRPTILKRRAAGSDLGFSYFAMKSALGTPIVVDTDGEIRWVGTGITNGRSAAFDKNGFVIGDQTNPKFRRLELDGSISEATLLAPGYTHFHHNIDSGKHGLLAELDAAYNGVANLETIVAEFTGAGVVLKEWNFETLLGAHMRSQNDDPGSFIRPGIDWLHINAVTYDPRDNSLIVSSRENFVFKVDYDSGALIWILGDPSKYWYTFPSLRAKALTLEAGGLYPIGQHATSITSDGLLMLFNNGAPSFNQPVGTPIGESRTWSAVSAYSIDPAARTAREAWRFDYDQTIRSRICSSAYEAPGKSLLVSYAVANNGAKTRLVGLDAAHSVVFDFEYANIGSCNTSWNATPINFDGMQFD